MVWNLKANIRGIQGAQGFQGVQGLPGVNAVGNDAAVAGYIGTAGASATKTALLGAYSGVNDPTARGRRGLNSPQSVGTAVVAGGPSAWDFGLVESPSIWFDAASQMYGMVFVGYDSPNTHAQVGLAWSADLLSWTKDAANPIFSYSGVASSVDENGTSGPVIKYDNGTYYLYYIGITGTGYEIGTKTLCLATATSIHGPWTRQGAIISPSGTGWRGTSIYHANPVERYGNKYLFFNTKGNDGKEYIGYATAPAWAGPWTVDDVNSPILSPGAGGAWDSTKVGDPSIYRVGDTWYMAYFGFNGTNASDGVAFTSDAAFPLGWAKYSGNPILTAGPAGSVDSHYAHKPHIVPRDGMIYHYYTCETTGLARAISLALDPAPWETAMYAAPELAAARTTTSTTNVSIPQATVVIDPVKKKFLQVRLLIRGNPGATASMTVSDVYGSTVTLTGNSYQNAESQWVNITTTTLFNYYASWKSSDGTTVSLGNLFYEFRWIQV